jgi:hypothetical protein
MDARVRGAVLLAAITIPTTAYADDATDKPDAGARAAPKEESPPVKSNTTVAAIAPMPNQRFTWEPFGFLRLQYKAIQNDPNVEFVGRDDGFELQNARVGVRGRYERKAAFVVSIDGALDERAQINVPEGKLKVGLRDAYADVYFSTAFDEDRLKSALLVRAGFFQSWAEPESQVPDTQREFVDRPIESRGVRATEGFQTQGLTPGRSLGAAVRYEPQPGFAAPTGGFELAVQNGADEFASNNDNDQPAVSLAGLLRFQTTGYLVAAGRYNARTVGDLPFRQDETDLQGSVGARVPAGPVGIGAGAVVTHTTFETTGGPSQNSFGLHAQLTFTTTGALPLTLGYRFGIMDPSSLFTTDRVMEHTVGGVLGMPRYRMRVQLQLTHVIEQAARSLSNSRAQLAAEVAL